MITIYGSPRSSAGRCFWCLEEVGAKYENKAIDMRAGEHKGEDYLKINPNGKIPALTDGEFNIWESMAINTYLAEAYKPELLGSNPKEKGLVHQWTTWSIAELQPPLIDVFIQLVFVPEDKRDNALIEKSKAKLPNLLNVLDSCLEGKKYLVAENFSLADINTSSVVSICDHLKYDLSEYKNIESWRGALSDRPAFQKFQKLCE